MKLIEGNSNYAVTEDGRVYSIRKSRFLKNVERGKKGRGNEDFGNVYHSVTITIGTSKKQFVHRLVAMAFLPNPNNLPQVNHKDGNHFNNDVSNLEWASNSDNQQHAFKTHLQKSGERRKRSKITNADAGNIRELNKTGITQYKLAKMFNLNAGTVHQIVKGRSYKTYSL